MKKTPTAVDIFSGAGGLTEGFLAAGINVVLSVEKHPHAALTHAFNHPDTRVLCGDICNLTKSTVESQVKHQTGSKVVDIVAGGPPCQGFSPAGKQCERDPRNELIHQFVRVVSELTPKCFVFENVPAITEMSNGRVIQGMLDAFWDLGYSIYGIDNNSAFYPDKYPVVDSSWFGVPQKRKRLILVGWREQLDSFRWLLQTKDGLLPTRQSTPVTIFDAIGDLDFLKAGYECHAYRKKAFSAFQKNRRSKSGLLFNHLATNHRQDTVEMFKMFLPGKTVSSIPVASRTGKQRVRRFAKNDVSPAILALPDDYIHYSQNRIPTVRELARLQSFDDDFVFLGKRTTSDKNRRYDVPQYTQVGNAVPPLLAKALAKSIVEAFGGRKIDLRNRTTRASRQNDLVGTSAFSGYGICSSLDSSLELFDVFGENIQLSFNDVDAHVSFNRFPELWSNANPAA